MTTSDRSHRDEHSLVPGGVQDDPQLEPAPPPPVMANSEAERAARAQREAAGEVAQGPIEQRKFIGDGDGVGGPPAASPPGDDDPSTPEALDHWAALRGPPRPRAAEHGDDISWIAQPRFEAYGLDASGGGGEAWTREHRLGDTAMLAEMETPWLTRER